jgi:hypothetical protein
MLLRARAGGEEKTEARALATEGFSATFRTTVGAIAAGWEGC